MVFLISAAAYVGSGLIFACLVPAKAQDWNFPKIQDIDGEKGPKGVIVREEAPKTISTEKTTV